VTEEAAKVCGYKIGATITLVTILEIEFATQGADVQDLNVTLVD